MPLIYLIYIIDSLYFIHIFANNHRNRLLSAISVITSKIDDGKMSH